MKYYVVSGTLQRIVLADNPTTAAEKSLESVHGETIDSYFYVDERGFREAGAEHKIPASDVLKIIGEDNNE